MTDLEKAREWADRWSEDDPLILADAKAAIKLIKGLPDQWVDVEEVREVINGQLSVYTRGTASHYIAEEITRKLKEALIAPKLPTLAELIKQGNDPEQYRWMQAKVFHTEELGCVTNFDLFGECATVLFPNGVVKSVPYEDITPLPGEPKLGWSGGVVDAEIVEESATTDSGSIHTPMQPSEVPPNEPWLIEVDGQKAIGTRYKGEAHAPWAVAALDGSFAGDYSDNAVTLIHKLVPETHALPEGMRLADNEEFGRVVTSPWADDDNDYRIFFLNEDARGGANYDFAHESTLTFLDGEPNA